MYTLLLGAVVCQCVHDRKRKEIHVYMNIYRGRDVYSQRDVLHHVEVDSQYIHMYVCIVWKPVTVSDVCSWSGQQLEVDNTHTASAV